MAQIKTSSNIDKAKNFTFQNLEPINYLKTFNKMLQYMSKPSTQLPQSSKELKTVRLSKFPLHPYYEQMQGISEGNSKKLNEIEKPSKKEAELEKLEEKFLNKHYTFVKGALQKIIHDNEDQQSLLLKSKKFYQANQEKRSGPQYEEQIVRMVKLRSQPKLRSIKNTINSARKTLQQNASKISNYQSARSIKNNSFVKTHTKHDSQKSIQNNRKLNRRLTITQQNAKNSTIQYGSLPKDDIKGYQRLKPLNENENNEEELHPIFKKLKPPQQIQKFSKRNVDEVDYILSARKTFLQTKHKNSAQTAYPMTDRTHNQSKTESKKSSHVKFSIKRSEADNTKNSNFKLKDNLKEQTFQDDEDERQKSIRQEALTKFKKEISISHRRKKRNDSQQVESLKDEQEDEDERFFKQVEFLQNQQMKRQQEFSNAVQDKIKAVKKQLNQRIQQVKKFDYSAPKESPVSVHTKKQSK